MYIDKLTLFIVGEVVVVYIVISVFLFYKGRLYNVLVQILKEMRRNRMLREILKGKKASMSRAANVDMVADLQAAVEQGGPEVFTNQVDARLDQIADVFQSMGHDLPPNFDLNDPPPEQLLALRHMFLNMEKEFTHPDQIPEHDHAVEVIEKIKNNFISSEGADPNMIDELTKQVAEQKARAENLERFEKMYQETYKELMDAQNKIEELQTIHHEDLAHQQPIKGENAEEIYRLKSEKFDLMENINKLNLELQKMKSAEAPLDYIEKQEMQLQAQAKYMKEADVCISLLEKELEAAHSEIDLNAATIRDLKLELQQAKETMKVTAVKPAQGASQPTMAPTAEFMESFGKIASAAKEQSSYVDSIKTHTDSLKAIEEAKQIAEAQEAEVHKLERSLQETEACITVLESELDMANSAVEELHKEMEEMKEKLEAAEELNQNGDKMEGVLEEFVTDSRDMLACISALEKENDDLKGKILGMGGTI